MFVKDQSGMRMVNLKNQKVRIWAAKTIIVDTKDSNGIFLASYPTCLRTKEVFDEFLNWMSNPKVTYQMPRS
jgi:hypothetical protein